MFTTTQDPAKEAARALKEAARDARDRVAEAEAKVQKLRSEQDAHDKEVAKVRAEVEKLRTSSGHAPELAVYPSIEAARTRAATATRLAAELRTAEDRVRLAKERARDAERLARPLSELARQRLQELANAAAADEELVSMGLTIPPFKTPNGRTATLALAARFGITPEGG